MAEVHPYVEKLDPYWRALGRFVFEFAEIERELQTSLRNELGISHETAKVVFSGTRVKAATDLINRAHEASGEPLDPWLSRALDRVGILLSARDRILHHGISFDADEAYVSDEYRNIKSRARRMPISARNLRQLTIDAITVHSCLVMANWHESWTDEQLREEWRQSALDSWRYIPPAPPQPEKRKRPNPKQASPPESSAG